MGLAARGICSSSLASGLGDRAQPPEPAVEVVELGTVRQVAVEQQERRLLVADLVRKVLDAVAAILEDRRPLAFLDPRDRRLTGDHAFQPRVVGFGGIDCSCAGSAH